MNLLIAEKKLREKYLFKYNTVHNRTYFKHKTCADCPFILLDDYMLNSILRELKNAGIRISKASLRDLLQSSFVEKYDPILDYFESIDGIWDGRDHILMFAKTVETTHEDFWSWSFRKWFVAMIACSLEKDVVNHTVIILIGIQGIGKSRWIEIILPPALKPYMASGKINPNSKDSVFLLSECVLINMEEIGTFNRSQSEAFKELITKQTIRERRAYAVFAENYERRASFIGSSNNKRILVDITGNRRFLVSEVLKFLDASHIDINQLYAQGYQLYLDGYRYWLDEKDTKRVNLHNEQFRVVFDEERFLLKYFEPASKGDRDVKFYNASEVIDFIIKKESNLNSGRLSNVEMGKVLRAKGFREKKIKGNKKYVLKLKL